MQPETNSDLSLSLSEDALEFFAPIAEEEAILDRLAPAYKSVSEMLPSERSFLNALILRNKPKKLLEIGVARGGSSVITINAIKGDPNAKLYAIDYADRWYADKSIAVGSIVKEYPELEAKYELYTRGLALKFMEKIGGEIDFCLIDTLHYNPGEIFDFLMVLPYLKERAIVVFHDVNLHTAKDRKECLTNNLLISAIGGKKLLQGNFVKKKHYGRIAFPNIAAIVLDKNSRKRIFEIFNLLTQAWIYRPELSEQEEIVAFFSRFYDPKLIDYLKEVFAYHNQIFDRKQSRWKRLIQKLAKKLNKIAE
jgi:predicted O-methyltransferase YrrM